jgi:hypothetical protein
VGGGRPLFACHLDVCFVRIGGRQMDALRYASVHDPKHGPWTSLCTHTCAPQFAMGRRLSRLDSSILAAAVDGTKQSVRPC